MTDFDQIANLVEVFLYSKRAGHENYFSGIVFDRDKLHSLLKDNIANPWFFGNIVERDNGEIVGILSAKIGEYAISKQLVANDLLLFFREDFSHVRALLRLITSYITWATEQGCYDVQLANSSGFKQEKFAQLMKLAGFKQFEVGFSRKV